jgi:His-Xaa-Ser system radical SAM maturase HxsC
MFFGRGLLEDNIRILILKKIKGQSFNINEYIIGRVTFKNDFLKTDKILVTDKMPKFLYGIKALIMPKLPEKATKIPVFISNAKELFEDDIVNITKDGNCNVIWDIKANHNAIFVTDACNSKCIMCPQPMPERPKSYFKDNHKLIDLLNKKYVHSLGITGGEPTLNITELCKLLNKIRTKFKNIPIHILTNGRQFAKESNLYEILRIKNLDITYGIPLYSDIEDEHDHIVGCNGAFNETIKGLYNLAKAKQKIEIRIVIMKQNYKKLLNITEFIYRNLPFVTHVAIMTMEYTGLAEKNFNEIFIDPTAYKEELFKAIRQFKRYNIEASVYNTPLCLLDRRIWEFSTDSISDWKKTFTNECECCKKKSHCSGVFSTSFTQSKRISKIDNIHKL